MSNYWEERAARRMYEDMKTAEEAAEDIRKLYTRASRYIQSQGSDIFEAFRRQTGLSEAEARRYLTQAKNPADVQSVIEFAKQIQDPARRQELLNWIKASATQSRLARLATLQDAIDTLVPMLYAQEMKYHQDAYRKIIQDAYLHKTFDIQQYAGFGKFVEPMDEKRIDKLMRERWLGSNYSSRLWGNTDRLAKSLRDELMVSFLTGRPQLATWRAIDAEFNKGQHAARRLVRTESNYLANQGHAEAYKDSGVEKYIYVATLDMKTSEICRGLDGKRFLVKNAQPGVNYPPMHPWCRSTTIAWMPDQLLARMKRTARDPITGKNYKVPANMTYNEWYKKYVEGNPAAVAKKKKSDALANDVIQHDKYKDVLGDVVPDKLEDFQDIKYNNSELWKGIKLDYRRQKHLIDNPDKALPTADLVLPEGKFTKYFFDPDSKRGWPKGQAFMSRLGYNADNWKEMRDEISSRAIKNAVIKMEQSEHGMKYTQEIVMYGKLGTPMSVRIGWIHDSSNGEFRLTTAMPGKTKI